LHLLIHCMLCLICIVNACQCVLGHLVDFIAVPGEGLQLRRHLQGMLCRLSTTTRKTALITTSILALTVLCRFEGSASEVCLTSFNGLKVISVVTLPLPPDAVQGARCRERRALIPLHRTYSMAHEIVSFKAKVDCKTLDHDGLLMHPATANKPLILQARNIARQIDSKLH